MRIVLEVILPWGEAGVYSGGVLWVRCGRTTGTGPAVCFFFSPPPPTQNPQQSLQTENLHKAQEEPS